MVKSLFGKRFKCPRTISLIRELHIPGSMVATINRRNSVSLDSSDENYKTLNKIYKIKNIQEQ